MAKKVKERSPTDTPDGSEIKPGMVCTMQLYSDRNVYLIEKISETGKTVYIRRAARLGKNKGWIKAEFDVELVKVQRNKLGHWRTIGDMAPCFVYMGVADPYYDRSF